MVNKKGNALGYEVKDGELKKRQPNDFIELNSAYIHVDDYVVDDGGFESELITSSSHVEQYNMKILIDDIELIEPANKYVGDVTKGIKSGRVALIFKTYESINENSDTYFQAIVTLKKNVHFYATGWTNKLYVLNSADEVADKVREALNQRAEKHDTVERQDASIHMEKEFKDLLLELTARMERLENEAPSGQPSKEKGLKPKRGPKM